MSARPNPFRRPIIRTLNCECGRITLVEVGIPHYYPIECLGCRRIWIGESLYATSRHMMEDSVYIAAGILRLESYLRGMMRRAK